MSHARVQTGFRGSLPTVIVLAALSGTASATTYDVASDAALQARLVHDWNNPSMGLQPGDDVILHGGVPYGRIHLFAHGTAAHPIRIHGLAGDPNGHPLISNSVFFDGSTYVTVDGMRIINPCTTFPVFFANGASGNTLTNSDISNSQCPRHETAGISVDQTAGPSNTISSNVVHD